MNGLISKKSVFIIAGFVGFIFLIGGSYALWKYASDVNANINTITYGLDYYINYTKGQDITNEVLNQSEDYTGGNSADIELWKKNDTYNIYGHIYLDVNEIGDNLRRASALKYVVLCDEEIISSGSLRGIKQDKKILLKGDIPLLTNKQLFSVYVWLDINDDADKSIGGEALDIGIRCEATMMELGLANYDGNRETIAEKIKNMYGSASKTTVINNGITYDYASSVNLMEDVDGNIRYYGANPSNYLYFNCSDYNNQTASTCETWRIIGLFGDNLKIVRGSSIGNYPYDNSNPISSIYGTNNWAKARIMKLLNPNYNSESVGGSLYYNGGKGLCYYGGEENIPCDFTTTGLKNSITRAFIEEMDWYLGGYNSTSVYPDQIYQYERSSNAYGVWKGKVALPYPSDYAYAADFNSCQSQLASYNVSSCTSTNWLDSVLRPTSTSYAWLITPYSSNEHYVWYVNTTGNLNYDSAYWNLGIFPTVYLDFSSSVLSGTGTASNPYKLN